LRIKTLKNKLYLFASLIGCLLFAMPAQAEGLLHIHASDSQEVITLEVPDSSSRKVYTMANPDRLVVDFPTSDAPRDIALPANYKGVLIKGVRGGQFNPQTARVVFDLEAPVNVAEVEAVDATQLAITIKEAPAAKTKASSTKPQKEEKAAKPKPPQKPIIVIDPGHGGIDPGASGPGGIKEKNVVLAYAKALKARLLKTGRYRVVLTREDDTFIMLRERVAIARKAGASIFISLHADSAHTASAHGLSVYTVSEQASDSESEALAARENKADVLSGLDLSEESKDVADILISLAQRETKNQSAILANMLIASLKDRIDLLQNTHRFAGFAVLKAPDVPSVLVEIGFLTNKKDEKLLQSAAHREKVISGIAAGIDNYYKTQSKQP